MNDTKTESNPARETVVRALDSILSGTITVSVNNFPFLKIDGETKTLDVEIKGFEQSGLRLSDLVETKNSKGGFLGVIRNSSDFAQGLNQDGWTVQIFEGRNTLLRIGRGVSPRTGFIWLNPLKLPKLISLI